MVIFPARLSTVHTVAQSISEVNNYVIRTELVTVIKVVASIQKRFQFISTGYIDLSKRRVSTEEIAKCEEKFAKAKAVSS